MHLVSCCLRFILFYFFREFHLPQPGKARISPETTTLSHESLSKRTKYEKEGGGGWGWRGSFLTCVLVLCPRTGICIACLLPLCEPISLNRRILLRTSRRSSFSMVMPASWALISSTCWLSSEPMRAVGWM